MDKIVIKASRRTVTGKQVGAMRRMGKLPGVMYGHNFESTPIILDQRETTRILNSISASSLVTVDLEGEQHSTLVREKQRNYIRGDLLHVDFQVVSLTEKIRARVSLTFFGLSPAVKDFNGMVVENMSQLEVESFPQDLPEEIRIDVSGLNRIGDSILVKDVKVSDKVEILENPDEVVAVVSLAGVEEEVVAPAEEEVIAEPEVIERGKKEEEEAAE